MTPLRAFLIICILIFVAWCLYGMVRLWKMKPPTHGTGCTSQWSSDCSVLTESAYDPTLISPTGKRLLLIKFTQQQGSINPIYNPTWYRFRYVNSITGGYSGFSDWTETPVQSGSCCLPCIGGVGMCDSKIGNGFDTCKLNLPTMGILMSDLDYPPYVPVQADGAAIMTTIHRYVGKPDETQPPDDPPNGEVGENIGAFNTTFAIGGKKYYGFSDALNPPCGSSDGSLGDSTQCSKSVGLCYQSGDIICTGSSCNAYTS